MNEKQMQMIQELIKRLKDTHAHNAEKYLNNDACNADGAAAAAVATVVTQCVNETLAHLIAKLSDIIDAE